MKLALALTITGLDHDDKTTTVFGITNTEVDGTVATNAEGTETNELDETYDGIADEATTISEDTDYTAITLEIGKLATQLALALAITGAVMYVGTTTVPGIKKTLEAGTETTANEGTEINDVLAISEGILL